MFKSFHEAGRAVIGSNFAIQHVAGKCQYVRSVAKDYSASISP